MGRRTPTLSPAQPRQTAANMAQAADAAALPPAAAPDSGYDALSETRKRLAAAAAGPQSLFGSAQPGFARTLGAA